MDNAITMNTILQLVAIIVALQGLLKALEWTGQKIYAWYTKDATITQNKTTLAELIKRMDKAEKDIDVGHKKAFEVLDEVKELIKKGNTQCAKECTDLLEEHKKEYFKKIKDIEDNITDLKAEYQAKTAVIELQIANLEKKQDVHNNLITRTFELEAQTRLQDEQIKVANHRIEDLERKLP